AVPLGVGEDVRAVGAFDDAGIFAAAGPLALLFGIVIGIEDGLGAALEVDAVVAFGESEARGVEADAHFAGVVLGAVEDADFAVAHDGGGVDGVERFPMHGLAVNGIAEFGLGARGDHG